MHTIIGMVAKVITLVYPITYYANIWLKTGTLFCIVLNINIILTNHRVGIYAYFSEIKYALMPQSTFKYNMFTFFKTSIGLVVWGALGAYG